MRLFVFSLLLVMSPLYASNWAVVQSPTTEHFNGIDTSPSGQLKIAVGNSGSIIHFTTADPAGVIVPSGTTEDLFDVHVGSDNFAVASGRDAILVWDGSAWSEILGTNPGRFLPIWATPEQDTVFFTYFDENSPPSLKGTRCYYDVATEFIPAFCKYGSLDLAYCGNSNDIKVLMANGDFEAIKNDGSAVNGTQANVHDDTTGLSLTSAYIPPGSCLPGARPPEVAFAVNNFNQIWQFDGNAWSQMATSLPVDAQLTWLDGTGPNQVIAVGFQPAPGGAQTPPDNDPVILAWDDNVWTSLAPPATPAATPGLTDISVNRFFQVNISSSSFEATPTPCSHPADSGCENAPPPPDSMSNEDGSYIQITAAAENGHVLAMVNLEPHKPVPTMDLFIEATVLNIEDLQTNQNSTLNYALTVANNGPATATEVIVLIEHIEHRHYINLVNCPDFSKYEEGPYEYLQLDVDLVSGGRHVCEISQTAPASNTIPATGWVAMTFEAYGKGNDRNMFNQARTCFLPLGACPQINGRQAIAYDSSFY